jgi:hypothetical protein
MTKTLTYNGKRHNLVSIAKEIGKIWKRTYNDIIVDKERESVAFGDNGNFAIVPFDELENYGKVGD